MKKAVSILLALVLCAVSCCAFAETLEIKAGTPTNAAFDDFKAQYDASAASQLPITWEDGSAAEGEFEVYTGYDQDKTVEVKVYTAGGKISYITISGTTILTASDVSGAQKLGTNIGMALGFGIMAVYFADGGTLTSDLISTFTADLQAVMSPLTSMSDYTKLMEGMAATGTVLEYPTGMEISAAVNGSEISLTMKTVFTSKDGQLSVK